MCGRFALHTEFSGLLAALKLPLAAGQSSPRYNIAPGTWINAVRWSQDSDQASLDALWWGYRPHWARQGAPQPINATVEKVARSPYFRGAFAHHRCLIPADGWYEWQPLEGRKQPLYFARDDGELLWFAGIWTLRPDDSPGCAILTEPARGVASEIHPRMPLLLDQDSLAPWLDPALTEREHIRRRVHHLPHERLTRWQVSTRVNTPTEDDPTLIEPAC